MGCETSDAHYPASIEEKIKEAAEKGMPTPGWGWSPKDLKFEDQAFKEQQKVLATLNRTILPTDPAERKKYPIATGVLDYFPSALLEVAKISYFGNEQHNPGQPLHHARGKSKDQADTTLRHYMEGLERGPDGELHLTRDTDGSYHLGKACWRLLALFQEHLEKEGAPLARGARLPEQEKS